MKPQTKLQPLVRGAPRIAPVRTGLVMAACSGTVGPNTPEEILPVADGSLHRHSSCAGSPLADQCRAIATLPRPAGSDSNANSSIDSEDDYMEHELLGAWAQEDPHDPCVFIEWIHHPSANEFDVCLKHFYCYAVSW